MKRIVVVLAVLALSALCILGTQRVLAQTSAPPAGGFESVVGFDVTREEGQDVYFSVLMRDVMGNMRVDVYDGSGLKRGEIQLKGRAVSESPIRPE